MLFNSYAFILAFLPLSLAVYHVLRKGGLARASVFALTALSLFFYGWWNPRYLLLLIPLTLFNYGVATWIISLRTDRPRAAATLLGFGVAVDLGMLAYFKYANFLVDNLNAAFGAHLFLATVVLPLGISFFTFQKIAFLVDARRGKVAHLDLLDFSLFVSFFPQLIAGPIVHHSEVLPQFRSRAKIPGELVMLGLTIFAVGLSKKVLLADTAALVAAPQFAAAAGGARLDLISAWSGALAYSAQLYFDFSGYSDMAIGAALLFGIRLPVNFDSPYKAASIIDFWRRWHITLSRFLRDYLYIPLGGNRRGKARRFANLLITMVLGGFWHGANWTFLIWGALHGCYLALNYAWRALRPSWLPARCGTRGVRAGQALTFLAVVVGWVFFRAADAGSALAMLRAMAGYNSFAIDWAHASASLEGLAVALALLLVAWLAPNTQQITGYQGPGGAQQPAAPPPPSWQPARRWAVAAGCLFGAALLSLSKASEFLYFQF